MIILHKDDLKQKTSAEFIKKLRGKMCITNAFLHFTRNNPRNKDKYYFGFIYALSSYWEYLDDKLTTAWVSSKNDFDRMYGIVKALDLNGITVENLEKDARKRKEAQIAAEEKKMIIEDPSDSRIKQAVKETEVIKAETKTIKAETDKINAETEKREARMKLDSVAVKISGPDDSGNKNKGE